MTIIPAAAGDDGGRSRARDGYKRRRANIVWPRDDGMTQKIDGGYFSFDKRNNPQQKLAQGAMEALDTWTVLREKKRRPAELCPSQRGSRVGNGSGNTAERGCGPR
jgi:hypothetical protein